MISLIGGPPRVGKTTLAKMMSKKLGMSWIACDTLDSIVRAHTPADELPKKFPYSALRRKNGKRDNDSFYSIYSTQKIVSVLKREAKTVEKAIETFIACEIADGNDYIAEGYQITPAFASRMMNKYGSKNIKAVFLGKFDAEKFAQDVRKSSTPNDWLLVLTKKEETFLKVGEMVALYSDFFEKEAKKRALQVFHVDSAFEKQLVKAMKYLGGRIALQ